MSDERTCPSGRCLPGATLLGIVGPTGRVAYVSPPIRIDADFIENTPAAEQRFRFAEPCVEAGCSQWSGSACGLAQRLVTRGEAPTDFVLPVCSIRKTCRWYAEHRADACFVCPLVITDNRLGGGDHTKDWDASETQARTRPSADRV